MAPKKRNSLSLVKSALGDTSPAKSTGAASVVDDCSRPEASECGEELSDAARYCVIGAATHKEWFPNGLGPVSGKHHLRKLVGGKYLYIVPDADLGTAANRFARYDPAIHGALEAPKHKRAAEAVDSSAKRPRLGAPGRQRTVEFLKQTIDTLAQLRTDAEKACKVDELPVTKTYQDTLKKLENKMTSLDTEHQTQAEEDILHASMEEMQKGVVLLDVTIPFLFTAAYLGGGLNHRIT